MAKVKLFKDASQGYINLYDRYVTNLIDTFEMQRLKDVAQTGMRPIFSGATHDRFSHSLGVFNNAVKMYRAFSSNLIAGLNGKDDDFVKNVRDRLKIYEEYYLIACILHDIGHPAYSHTYEYLYNDNTVLLENEAEQNIDNITIKIDRKELERIVQLIKKSPEKESELQKTLSKSIKSFYNDLRSVAENSWGNYCHPDTTVDESSISGQPHEMMGAYQILRSEKIQKAVTNTFQEFSEKPNNAYQDQRVDFAFLSCMIIGAKYINVGHRQTETDKDPNCYKWDASLRNCIIELLNGLMDADSMDYLNRNSHFAGYSTTALDVTRLTNAFSAFYDSKQGVFISCLEKSALSVMEGFIQARNFEPKWLYSHHKIVYCTEFLFKYLFKKCSRYIFARDEEKWNKLICEYYTEIIFSDAKIQPYIQKHGGHLPDTDSSLNKERVLLRETISNLTNTQLRGANSVDQIDTYLDTKVNIEEGEFVPVFGKNLLDKIPVLSDSFNQTGEVEKLCVGLLELVCKEAEGLLTTTDPNDSENFLQLALSVISYIDEIDNLLAKVKNAYLGYIISPVARFEQNTINGDIYFKSTDPDIASIFKKAYLRYGILSYDELDPAEKRIGQKWEYPFFQDTLKEFQTHEYRQSLWKSVEEYTLFLNQISLSTGLSKDTISDFLVKKLIPEGGKIDFEDPSVTYRSNNRYEINGIFINGINCTKEFDKVFRVFGNGLVIRITIQKFKSFNKLKIRFGNDILCGEGNNGIVFYSDISDQKVPPKKWIPYIYYKFDDLKYEVSQQVGEDTWGGLSFSEQKSRVRKYLLEKLKTGVEEAIVNSMKKEVRVYDGKMLFSDGSIIRDPVHGDIYIPKKFMDIIDTRVFQRLRRIKQLATADYVFPDAGHTRFSHSVGTFYVMRLILGRFTKLFDYLGIKYTEEEIDAALAAALLHDIGHGPYSHVFEHIYGKLGQVTKTHEDWTKDIIEQDQELQLVFKQYWDDKFYLKVLDCLSSNSGNPVELKLKDVYASLISSQLDADRIDYLMRDSYHTGVNFGTFDLQRLISSMLLAENNGKICVCFDESAIPIIEQFITGRYNMYSEVYYSPYKVFSEELLRKAVFRIIEKPDLLNKGSVLSEILEGSLSLEKYLKLDDRFFMREIQKCADSSKDSILNAMLDSLSYRKGFKRLHVLNDSYKDTLNFLKDFKERFKESDSLESLNGVVFKILHFDAYSIGKSSDDNIKNVCISLKNAGLTAFENLSRVFSIDSQKKSNKLWMTNRAYLYYNIDILNEEWKTQSPSVDEESFISFINQYDIRKHTEIENKYWCRKEDIERCEDVLKCVAAGTNSIFADFEVDVSPGTLELNDKYFDTDKFEMFGEDLTIRMRSLIGHKTIVTVKKSGISEIGYDNGQFIRSEYEYETEETDITKPEIVSFINKSIRNMDSNDSDLNIDFNLLKERIEIVNNRTNFIINRKQSDFKCVVSLDRICCKKIGTEQFFNDYQIEIELKSPDPIKRIELRSFSEKLIKEAGITSTGAEESKYKKALKTFNLL